MTEQGGLARRRRVTWLGILAFWILLCMIPLTAIRFSRPLQHALPLWFARSSGFLLLGALLLGVVVGTIVFIVDATKIPRLTTTSKVTWIAGILILGPVIFPFYWWIHVFRAPKLA